MCIWIRDTDTCEAGARQGHMLKTVGFCLKDNGTHSGVL